MKLTVETDTQKAIIDCDNKTVKLIIDGKEIEKDLEGMEVLAFPLYKKMIKGIIEEMECMPDKLMEISYENDHI